MSIYLGSIMFFQKTRNAFMKLAKFIYCKNTTNTQRLPHLSQNSVIFTKLGPNMGIAG